MELSARVPSVTRALQVALYLAGEAAWLGAWSVGLGSWLGPTRDGLLVGLPTISVLLVAAAGVTRAVASRFSPPTRIRVLATFGVLLAMIVGFATSSSDASLPNSLATIVPFIRDGLGGRGLAAIALALVVWVRGIAVGRARLSREDVEGGLRFGVIALTVLFVGNALATADVAVSVGPLVTAVLVVLFAGLIGMPLARILDLSAREQRRAGTGLGVSRHWLGMIAGAMGVLLLVAVLLVSILTFERLDQLLGPIVNAFETILGLVVYAIALPIGLLVQLLVDLLQSIMRPAAPRVQILTGGISWLDQVRQQAATDQGPSALLVTVVRLAIIAAIVALVMVFIARAVAHYADSSADDGVDEDRDFVLSWRVVAAAIRGWLARWRRPRIRLARPTTTAGVGLASGRGSLLDPREIYRELLRLGARLGRPRFGPTETPAEYERQVATRTTLGSDELDLAIVTSVYAEARYSADPVPDARVAEARRALERLREIEIPVDSP